MACGSRGQIASKQSALQTTRPIDHQNTSQTIRLHSLFDMAVVLIALHGQHLSMKRRPSTKIFEDRRQHPKITRVIRFVRVTKITGRKRSTCVHRHHHAVANKKQVESKRLTQRIRTESVRMSKQR